jgi:hypothetical protein
MMASNRDKPESYQGQRLSARRIVGTIIEEELTAEVKDADGQAFVGHTYDEAG